VLGLPGGGPEAPVTAPQLDRMYPGLVPWHQAHPVQFGMAGAAVAVAVSVVITVVLQFAL
jgi:hypothetical protein